MHHIDLMRFFCGEIRSLHAAFSPRHDTDAAPDVALSFQFEGGALGTLIGGVAESASMDSDIRMDRDRRREGNSSD